MHVYLDIGGRISQEQQGSVKRVHDDRRGIVLVTQSSRRSWCRPQHLLKEKLNLLVEVLQAAHVLVLKGSTAHTYSRNTAGTYFELGYQRHLADSQLFMAELELVEVSNIKNMLTLCLLLTEI